MGNKYVNQGANPSKQSGGEGGSNKATGSTPSLSMPEKPVGYPGALGKTQKSRSGGAAPQTGYAGPFYVDKEGL